MRTCATFIEICAAAAVIIFTASLALGTEPEPLPRNCCAYHTCGGTTVQDCLGMRCPAGRACTAIQSGCEPNPYVVAGCIPIPV